jgi:alpha-beta hydrolase superfamily lysophospholipase
MGERIPDAEVHVLPGLRHSLLIEATAAITELLEKFLAYGTRSNGQGRATLVSSNAR